MNMLKKDMAKTDPKYKELVGIDKFTEYSFNSLLKNRSNSNRKRRDVSEESITEQNGTEQNGTEQNNTKKGNNSRRTYPVPDEDRFDSLSQKDSSVANFTRYIKGLGYSVLRSMDPHLRDAMREVIKNWQASRLLNMAKEEKGVDKERLSRGSGRNETRNPESDDGKTTEELNDDELQDDELLTIRTATEKSRDKRETYEDDDGSGSDYDDNYWDYWYDVGSNDYYDDDESYYDYDDDFDGFEFADYGFAGRVQSDYAFKQFMKASKTNDFSDLIDVLKPSKEDLDAYGHQAADFILQCSFDKINCSYL